MTPLKANEIRKMEAAGQLAARTLVHVAPFVKAGVTTDEIDKIVHDFTLTNGAKPAPLGYHGFPKSVCTSVNECICHGVPGEYILKDGDAINVDVTCVLDGYHGDTSTMFFIGDALKVATDLSRCAKEAMHKGIEQVGPGKTTGDIGFAINKFVTRQGYFPVKEIGGHGIGKVFHDDPFVPSHGKKAKGVELIPWVCITVEPMVNETSAPIKEFSIADSTIKYYETGDGTLSAQYEHTVLVTDAGHQILTLP